MALPAYDYEPVPPEAEPGAIRACLTAQMLADFDSEWDFVLDEAKRIHSLEGVQDLLAKWRLMAYHELKYPGSYARMMAKVELIRRTGANPDAVSVEDMRELLRKRLAG